MDRRERYSDPDEAMRVVLDSFQARLWTALPGIITEYDSTRLVCAVQPAILGTVVRQDGQPELVNLPLLVDVPVVFPQGGGFTLTFPLAAGDEVLVVFASRCVDAWWQQGGVQPEAEYRMHNLSDGFAIVGPRSQGRPLDGVSASNVQLRTDDGTAYLDITPEGAINLVAPAGLNIVGNVNITGQVDMNGVRVDETHTHSGVQTGGGTSGPVTP